MKKILGIAAVVFLFSVNVNAQAPAQVKKEVATAKKACCSDSKDAKSSCDSKKEVASADVKKSSCDSKKEVAATEVKKACCSSKKEVATKE